MPLLSNWPEEMKVLYKLISIACWLMVCLEVGCSEGLKYAPVEGTITAEGKGVPGLRVAFQPTSGGPEQIAVGVTDQSGKYQLSNLDGKQTGAAVGRNQVLLSFGEANVHADELTPLPKQVVPLKFRDGSLEYEVKPEGNLTADFEIGKIRPR